MRIWKNSASNESSDVNSGSVEEDKDQILFVGSNVLLLLLKT